MSFLSDFFFTNILRLISKITLFYLKFFIVKLMTYYDWLFLLCNFENRFFLS